MFEEMIPPDVSRILDVGCGDGAITDRLAEAWEVTGVDASAAALAHVQTTAVQAPATALPFDDGAFDLVLSSEMLEHLTDEDYKAALSEMARVTRRYLLLSVPYREDLGFRVIRCPRCGWRGHVWGHRRGSPPSHWPRTSTASARSRRARSGRRRSPTGPAGCCGASTTCSARTTRRRAKARCASAAPTPTFVPPGPSILGCAA